MRKEDFPNCCGISILSGFGNTTTSFCEDKTNKEIEKYILRDRESNYGGKIQMIVLNEVQLNKMGRKLFLNLGFRIRCIGLYSGHGNKLYTLFYNINGNS